jgi:anti-sigma regulatory factor (Ser/Thr protein kinase)
MATCELTVPADPEHIRIARLVASSAARRAGMAEDAVEDVRWAVSEAVTRAIVRHRATACDDPVAVRLSDEPGRFAVEVRDRGTGTDDEAMAMVLTVIHALVPGAQVQEDPAGGEILRMAWDR